MSYASVLRNIPEFMGQPAGVAALASLGIHGAIALILPLVPVSTSKADKQVNEPKSVGLTTLSPKEISRLPQTVNNNIAKPNLNGAKPAPGLSAQLPPMPSSSSAPNVSPLPPLPALSSASLEPLPPLPGATNVSVPKFPRGGKIAQNLKINTGFPPAPPLALKNYPPSVGNPIIGNPVVMSRNPGATVNTGNWDNMPSPPAAPPPISDPLPPEIAAGMAPQNGGGTVEQDAIAANPSNNDFVTPVGDPSQSAGQWTLASQPVPGMGVRPTSSLNSTIDANLGNTPNQTSPGNRISPAQKKANHFTKAQQTYPQLQSANPENLTMDRDGLESNVDVALVVKADGTIEDLQIFTQDDRQLSFESRDALRKFLSDRLEKNPPAKNGKPIYLSFNITPQGKETPATTADSSTPSSANRNNEDNLETPSQPISSFEVLSEDSKPVQVNTIKPQLEPDPSFSKPVRLRQPRPIQIPTQKPSNNQPATPTSSQKKPAVEASQSKTQNWRERLTNTKSSETRQESSGIEKLRQLAKTRNQLDD